MRSYTVKEIDDLREACTLRWLHGTTTPYPRWSKPYTEERLTKCVEELVRTAMLGGIIAEDIYEEDRNNETSNSRS